MKYDNTNRISLWKNTKKESEKHPDYTGTVNVDGVEYFVDCWKKPPTAPEQAPVLSGKVKRKDKQPAQAISQEDIYPHTATPSRLGTLAGARRTRTTL